MPTTILYKEQPPYLADATPEGGDLWLPVTDLPAATGWELPAPRYDKGTEEGDEAAYVNCPFDEAQYRQFVQTVVRAEKVAPRSFEDVRYFEGCLPVEVMAEIDAKVDMAKLEETLMGEGVQKFADPHKALLKLIAEKRQ